MRFSLSGASDTYAVTIGNASGSVTSNTAQVSLGALRAWQDTSYVLGPGGVDGVSTVVADASGRTHVVSVATPNGGNPTLRLSYFSANDANDANWSGGSSTFGLGSGAGGSITSIRTAAGSDGSVMVVWDEIQAAPIGGATGKAVRAAVYQPSVDPLARGTWTLLTLLSDGSAEARSPAVASIGPGRYEIAWLQVPAGGSVHDVVARRFTMPASGAPSLADLGPIESLESTTDPLNGPITLVGSNGASWASFFRADPNAPRWQANHRPANASWNPAAPADIAVSSSFGKLTHAVNAGGTALLATANANGQLYLRRLDVVAGTWLDNAWTYSANAFGSDPALLIDDSGRCDVFGIYMFPNLNYATALMHWSRPAGGAWSNVATLASSNTNYNANDGLRAPVAGRDAAGNIVLAYHDRPAGGIRAAKAMRYSALSQAWTPVVEPLPTSAGVAGQDTVSLAVGGNGAATVVLRQSDNSSTNLRMVRLR